MVKTKKSPGEKPETLRDKIARLVVYLSLVVMFILGGLGAFLIYELGHNTADKERTEAQFDALQFVFASIVPVIGTWMGTVMAFYFSKENLEAANRSVKSLIQHISSNEKLASIKSSEVMIK